MSEQNMYILKYLNTSVLTVYYCYVTAKILNTNIYNTKLWKLYHK